MERCTHVRDLGENLNEEKKLNVFFFELPVDEFRGTML
jgi:hypothetical protein